MSGRAVSLQEGSLVVPLQKGRRSDASILKMQALGYDPMEVLITYAHGENTPMDVKLDIAKTLLPFMYPKLSQVDVEVEDKANSGTGNQAALAIVELLKDADMVKQAQKLSLRFQEISRTVTVTNTGETFDASEVMEGPDVVDIDPEDDDG